MKYERSSQSGAPAGALTYSEAMDCALFALAPRARSRAELHEHLIKRGAEEEVASGILDTLELQGLLNDLEFAKIWAESRQRQKKLSKRIIASELRQKGVAADIIEEALAGIDSEEEYELAFALAEKKYRASSHLDPDVAYRRISSLLARKGFNHQMMSRIMNQLRLGDEQL